MDQTSKNTLVQGWPDARCFRKSIRVEFSLYISCIIFALMLITGYIMTDRFVNAVTQQVVEKLLTQARSYSTPAGKLIISAAGPDILLLNNVCRKFAADNQAVYWVGIADSDGKFIAHTDIAEVLSSRHINPVTSTQFGELSTKGEEISLDHDTLQIVVPILDNGIVLGKLAAAASPRQIDEARRSSIVTVSAITILMIITGTPFTLLLMSRKLRPISLISDHLRKIDFENIAINIPVVCKNEFGYLAETLRVMGEKLNGAQRELVQNERMARELEIAHEIQSNMLPEKFPKASEYEFAGCYRSAREVGGDYYDFIDFDEQHIAFLIADVSGKSLPGMLVMLMVRDIVKTTAPSTCNPAEVLSRLNRELLPSIRKGMFVTMSYGLLNRKAGTLTFASAGHNPLILHRAQDGKTEILKPRGYPLGIMPPAAFEERIQNFKVNLSEDDWVLQYTDGVTEAHNAVNQEFGLNRLVSLLESGKGMSPGELVSHVVAKHQEFVGNAPQFDDITLLLLKWKAKMVEKKNNGMMELSNVG